MYFYLLDLVRGQWGFTKSCQEFVKLAKKWPTARKKLVEDKANGTALENQLRKAMTGIKLVEPNGGKLARAWAAEPAAYSGNVWIPDPDTHPPHIAEWVEGFMDECAKFPNVDNDDQVDSYSQAIAYLDRRGASSMRKLGL